MSRASHMIIDNATQRAIEQGKLDLRHASPALQQIAVEIRAESNHHHRGFFGSLFGKDRAEEQMDDIKQSMKEKEKENELLMKEHQKWAQKHRSKSAPSSWTLLTDDDKGVQTYSDGNRIHYYSDGKEMDWQAEKDYVDKHYGSSW